MISANLHLQTYFATTWKQNTDFFFWKTMMSLAQLAELGLMAPTRDLSCPLAKACEDLGEI